MRSSFFIVSVQNQIKRFYDAFTADHKTVRGKVFFVHDYQAKNQDNPAPIGTDNAVNSAIRANSGSAVIGKLFYFVRRKNFQAVITSGHGRYFKAVFIPDGSDDIHGIPSP